jgi:hypothetical protein
MILVTRAAGSMSSFSGPVFRPDDGYDAERAGFNRAVDDHPELIVGAAGPEDVAAAVSYAPSRGLAVGNTMSIRKALIMGAGSGAWNALGQGGNRR